VFEIYLFEREKETVGDGGAEGEREKRISRESQANFSLSTEPDVGLHLTTLRS